MRRRPPRAVPAAVALAVLAACGGGRGEPQAVRASAGPAAGATTTTTAPAPPATSSTTTARPGASTTPTRPATTTTRPASVPTPGPAGRALAPPTPGTYRYDTSGATTFGIAAAQPFPAVTTLVVDPPVGTTQRSTRSLRDAAGNGPVTELTLDYRPRGVYLVALKVTVGVGGVSTGQELRPAAPVLLLATGARPGAHSEADLGAAPGAHLTVDVVGDERVTVAGQGVDALVMKAVVTLAPGDVSGRQELTVDVDPASRLWVKEQAVSDASAAGGLFQLHSQYTATLQRLAP